MHKFQKKNQASKIFNMAFKKCTRKYPTILTLNAKNIL